MTDRNQNRGEGARQDEKAANERDQHNPFQEKTVDDKGTAEDEAALEQQRKDALTERD
jgi:hypothetical protein